MQFIKLLEYTPQRQFILRHKEQDGILEAFVCERAYIRTQVANATKREFEQVLDKVEDAAHADCEGKFVIAREKLVNLATIYCIKSDDGELIVFDIHYHKNGYINGFRTEEKVKTDTLAILKHSNYRIGLSIGAFMSNKRHHGKPKTYKKLK